MIDTLHAWEERCTRAAQRVIAAVLEHLPQGGTFVDVGANVGVVTRAAIEQRQAVVYAFEPVPEYHEWCQRTNPTAKVLPVALGVTCERLTLWCDDTNLGWNTFVTEKTEGAMRPVDVKVMPLDMFGEVVPDVIKIDTEGYEWAVIRGGHRMIETHRPVMIVELGWGRDHPHRDEVVREMEWLFSIGYQRVPYEYARETTDFVLVP